MKKALVAAVLVSSALLPPVAARASAIVPGFDGFLLAPQDDSPSALADLGFTFNFFGSSYAAAYVNNNGNVTFGNSLDQYTPSGLRGIGLPIIAPYFADVDTRPSAVPGAAPGLDGGPVVAPAGTVRYGTGTFEGHAAFGVTWDHVGYYRTHQDLTDTFQVILVDRPDVAPDASEIVFDYGSLQWETGDASGGHGGFGGASAYVGYSDGDDVTVELPGSGVNHAFVDGGSDPLMDTTQDGVRGRLAFLTRGGSVQEIDVPEPALPAAFALIGLAFVAARRRRLA